MKSNLISSDAVGEPLKQRQIDSWLSEPHHRYVRVRKRHIDEGSRTVEVAFSSDEEIQRWFGIEVLGHEKDQVDLSRLQQGAPLLVEHDTQDHVGVVESVRIDTSVGRAVVRFGTGVRASEVFQDVVDGIKRHVSVGYFVHEMELLKEVDDGPNVFRVSKWEPFEISIVAVPADVSVGVGRGKSTYESMEIGHMDNHVGGQTRSQRKATKKIMESDRERIEQLRATGIEYGATELAEQFIQSGGSVHDLNQVILERGGLKPTNTEDPNLGLSRTELSKYSVSRAILAQADPQRYAQQAGLEIECSRAIEQSSDRQLRGNIHIPHDVLVTPYAQRAASVGSAGAGGNLVEDTIDSASFVDLLRNQLALVIAGATYINGLVGNMLIPRQTGTATTFWIAENAAPDESSAVFDQIPMTPKTVGAYSEISRLALLQTAPAIDNLIMNDLASAVTQAIDLAGIAGTGANDQPIGLLNQSGVGVTPLGPDGAAPGWDDIVNMESDVAAGNAEGDNPAYLTNSHVRGRLKRTFIDSGSGERVWDNRSPDTPVNGTQAVISNQVPSNLTKGSGTNLSAVIYGNWKDLIVGLWGGLDLLVNPYSLDTIGAVRITSFQTVDIALRHAESFNVINDAVTT